MRIRNYFFCFTFILVCILCLLEACPAYAQDKTDEQFYFLPQGKNKGIYRTFEEFKNNAPSIPFSALIIDKEESVGIFEDLHVYYQLKFTDSLPCSKQTVIWGFCDGNAFFISRSYKFDKNNLYDRIISSGKVIFYESTEWRTVSSSTMLPMAGGGMMAGGNTRKRFLVAFIMDVNTGVKQRLTEALVREIIADDKTLSLAFEKEVDKNRVLRDYVIFYTEKYPGEVKK